MRISINAKGFQKKNMKRGEQLGVATVTGLLE